MTTLLDDMPASAPDVANTVLAATTEDQAVKCRITLPVAQPLVIIVKADQVGLRGDAVEAEALAHLAVRTAKGLPISFPGTTGVAAPLTGGRMAYPV